MGGLGSDTTRLASVPVIVHLVRHGRPTIDPDRPPARWELASESATGIARLRESGVLPTDAHWVSSTEPKALATARSLTDGPVVTTDTLREMHRPGGLLTEDQFLAAVRASLIDLDRPGHPDWETGRETTRRMHTVVLTAVLEAGKRDLVLVGHGTALTLLVATFTGTAPDVTAWEQLAMPDHCALVPDRDQPPGGARHDRMLSAWVTGCADIRPTGLPPGPFPRTRGSDPAGLVLPGLVGAASGQQRQDRPGSQSGRQ